MIRVNKAKALHSHKLYELQIERYVHGLKAKGADLYRSSAGDVSVLHLYTDKTKLAKCIANDIRNEKYIIKPPQIQIIKDFKGKERKVFHYSNIDKVVIGAITYFLSTTLSKYLHKDNYAYQKNKGCIDAIVSLAKFIKKNRNEDSIYLYFCDIKSYTDTITVGPKSVFHRQLDQMLKLENCFLSDYQRAFITEMMRPSCVYNEDGIQQCFLQGIPTGSAITSFLYNYYVTHIDLYLQDIDNLYFSRYCDDIVISHKDVNKLIEVSNVLKEKLKSLNLVINENKEIFVNMNKSGNKASPQPWISKQKCIHLGFEIRCDGSITLTANRINAIFKYIKKQIKHIHNNYSIADRDALGRKVCATVNRAFVHCQYSCPDLMVLLKYTTDHNMLKSIDYKVALIIAQHISGLKGTKAFRVVTYKKIRKKWGLKSLCLLRNNLVLITK